MQEAELTPSLGRVRGWLAGVGELSPTRYLIYHRGHLAFDRMQLVMGEDNQPKWVVCVEVDKIAKLVWKAHEDGEVVLVQKRLGPRDWLYLAERSLGMRRLM